MTKIGERVSKAYLYNDKGFESYDDASRTCAEDGHLGSSCKEYIDEVDFVRSAQVGNEKLEGNEMTDSEKYRRAWLVRFRGGAECLDLTKDYGRIAAPTEKIPGYFLTDSDLTALKEQHEAELREAFQAGWESDTYVLKRQGWQVFVNEQMAVDAYEKQIHLGLKSPDNKLLIMGIMRIGIRHLMEGPNSMADILYHVGVDMQTYRSTDMVQIHTMKQYDWNAMDSMSLTEGMASVDFGDERKSLGDLQLFKVSEAPKEIYIPHNSVDECLNRILQLQYPEQQEIKRQSKIEQFKAPVIQARVYALAA